MTGIDLAVLAFAATMSLVVAAWVGRPLWHGQEPLPPPDARAVNALARRQASLAALRDLESDHADGRIASDDYAVLREEIVARGAAALAALDALAASTAADSAALVAAIEQDVATRRIFVLEACRDCGAPLPAAARFCPSCGAAVEGSRPSPRHGG